MEQQALSAELREQIGSVAVRRLRRAGRVPAVVYGHRQDPVSVALSSEDAQYLVAHRVKMVNLSLPGKTESVLLKDVQFDVYGEVVLHIDFERVAMDEVIEVECPVELVGTAKGAAAGGVVEHPVTDLHVRCLPANIPQLIRVRVSDLAIGDSIHVRDVEPPDGVTVLTDPESILVTIRPPAIAEEPEAAEAEEVEPGGEEPEVIGRKKEDEEDQAGQTD